MGLVGAYQVSGIPYLSGPIGNAPLENPAGGPHKIEFPAVTRWIKLSNLGSGSEELNFAFSSNGLANLTNAGAVVKDQTLHLEVKVTELYYTGSCSAFSIAAGLTYIETEQIDNQSVSPNGTNWSGSLIANVG